MRNQKKKNTNKTYTRRKENVEEITIFEFSLIFPVSLLSFIFSFTLFSRTPQNDTKLEETILQSNRDF